MPEKFINISPSNKLGLSAQNIYKSFKNKYVCKDININLSKGEIVGLLGPNGAGKTTIFNILSGIAVPDKGNVYLDGLDITKKPIYKRSRLGLGYLPQTSSVFRGMTVEHNILSVLELMNLSKSEITRKFEKCINEFNLTKFRFTSASMLSGGERRRLEIARTSLLNTNYFLLDEPFAGVDPISIGEIHILLRQIKNKGNGLMITDHNILETLEIVDRVYVLIDGIIVFNGKPKDLTTNKQVKYLYLGKRFGKHLSNK